MTPSAVYGELPRRPYGEPEQGPSRAQFATLVLAFVIGAWLVAMSAAHATSREVASATFERTVVALTDIDALLLIHENEIRRQAGQAAPADRISVPGFPIPAVTLPADVARDAPREEWRALLLADSATMLYEEGIDVFAQEGEPIDGGALTTSGGIQRVIGLLSERNHQMAGRVSLILGVAVLLLGALVVLLNHGARRFVALGFALIGGGILAAIAGVALIGLLTLISHTESIIADEVGEIVRMLAWMPIHEAIRAGVAGFVLLLPAAIVAFWLRRSGDDRDRYDDPEYAG